MNAKLSADDLCIVCAAYRHGQTCAVGTEEERHQHGIEAVWREFPHWTEEEINEIVNEFGS